MPLSLTPTTPGTLSFDPAGLNVGLGADYVVSLVSGTARAQSLVPGLSSHTGTDPAAVCQSAITSLGAAGGTIILDGALTWGSVPALPKSVTGKLRIIGSGKTTVTLSSNGPRLFDFDRTADYDTFQNIEIGHLTVDCNSVGGQHHIIIGTYVSGVNQARINVKDLYVHDVTITNAPIDTTLTNHRLGIHIVPTHAAASETQTVLERIRVERVKQSGGNFFCTIAGLYSTGVTTTGLNIYLDDIDIKDCWHDLGAVQSSSQSSLGHIQIGSRGFGGHARISGFRGYGSADVGIEVDASIGNMVVEDCVVQDYANAAFYVNCFNNPPNSGEKLIRFVNCHARNLSSASTTSRGWSITTSSAPTVALGEIRLQGCSYYRSTAPAFQAEAVNLTTANGGGLSKLSISDFTAVADGVAVSSGTPTSTMIETVTNGADCVLDFRNLRLVTSGAVTNAATCFWSAIRLGNTGANTTTISFDDVTVSCALSGNGGNAYSALNLSSSGGTATYKGTIRRFNVLAETGSTNPIGATIRGAAYLTVPSNAEIRFVDCDLQATSAGNEFNFVSDTASNAAKVFLEQIKWVTFPKLPVSATVAATTVAQQYLNGYRATLVVTGGTGTKVEVSVDNATWYTVLSQAAGAFNFAFPLDHANYYRLTYTVAPTMVAIPEK